MKNELLELKYKLEKLGKRRIGAGVLAAMIAATPIASKAENNKDDKKESTRIETSVDKVYTLDLGDFLTVSQEKKSNPVSMENYFGGVNQASKHVMEHFDLLDEASQKKLIQRMACLYFLGAADYITEEMEQELINGVKVNGNVYHVLFNTDTSNNENYSIENFEYAKELLDEIVKYNDKKIRKTNNIDDLIDYSILCYNENDRRIMRSMFEHWFNAHKKNTFDKKSFTEVFKELTTLNSEESKYNAFEMSFGSRWIAQYGIGHNAMQFIRDYLKTHYSKTELEKYFTKESLEDANGNICVDNVWVERNDFYLNLQCLNDLEYWVFNYGQLWKFCILDVDKDITRAFQRSNEVLEESQVVEQVADASCSNMAQLSVEDYFKEVNNNVTAANNYLKYSDSKRQKNLLQQIECLEFLTNCEYTRDIESELVNGVEVNGEIVYPIFETDMTKIADKSGIQNFIKANDFLSDRADYNQSIIRKTKDINNIIDVNIFCHDEKDKEYVNYLVNLWFESHKGNTYNFKAFEELFNELTSEKLKDKLSIGSTWMVLTSIGNDALNVLREYMREHYTTKELCKYFRQDMLNAMGGQFFLRDDVEPQKNSSYELERIAYMFKELWRVSNIESCNEIFEYFGQSCKVKTK